MTVLNATKNNIAYLNYKMKSRRISKKGNKKQIEDETEQEDSTTSTKWIQLKYLNLSFNRVIEISKFYPRKLLVSFIRN